MQRRDFLHPRRLAHAAGQLSAALDLSLASESPLDNSDAGRLLRVARRAMATDFEVFLPFGSPAGVEAAEAALAEIDRVEGQLSVYQEASETSDLNRRAATEDVVVTPALFALLALSARLTNETQGAFDVSAGALVKAWGFFRRQGQVPSVEERRAVLGRTGMRHVRLHAETHAVRFLRPGLEINFGSIGKGHALDRAAEILRRGWKITAGLLHGGHSSVYAIGSQPGERRGWTVGVRHPWKPNRRLAMVRLRDRALATSAATFQHLEYNGRKLGHVLDPRIAWPAETVASATVVAPTAAEADALSTAFFVLGVEGARRYCQARSDVGALLLPADAVAPIVVGLASDDVEL